MFKNTILKITHSLLLISYKKDIYLIRRNLIKLTKDINPIDLYIIITDLQTGNNTGYKNLQKSIGKNSTMKENMLNFVNSENMKIFGKQYPIYIEKYILEWLCLYSNTSKKIVKLPEIKSSYFRYKQIKNLFKLVNKINLKYQKLSFPIEESSTLIIDFLKKTYNSNYRNDLMEEGNNYYIITRINFIQKKINNFKFVEEYFHSFIQLYFGLNSTALPNSYPISSKHPEYKGIMNVINLLGVSTIDNYVNKIQSNGEKYYFNNENDPLNRKLLIDDTPFIKSYEEDDKYIYAVLNRGLGQKFFLRIRDKLGKDKFGIFIEEYCDTYFKYQIDTYLEEKENYISDFSFIYIKGDADIDFFIYNKRTKNIIIFEIKFKNELNEKIGFIKDISKLCKKGGEIYKGVSQLKKHKDRISRIEKKIGEKIKKSQYVFLNYSKSMSRNTIMRELVNKELGLSNTKNFQYTFMSLQEFEFFIHMSCKDQTDFFDILDRKNEFMVIPHSNFIMKYKPGSGKFNIEKRDGKKYGYIEDDMRQYLMGIADNPIEEYSPFKGIEII